MDSGFDKFVLQTWPDWEKYGLTWQEFKSQIVIDAFDEDCIICGS
jgi:hypothetical protein